MRKVFFAMVVLSMFSTICIAQERSKGDVELTPIIGYASSNYYGEKELNNSNLSSVSFGVDADYFFNDRWSLRSGLIYQTMGSKVTSYYSEKLNYLTLPINANWHFGSTRKWNLNFGPNLGFLMSAKSEDRNVSRDIKDAANGLQLGLAYGIGYKIEVNEKFSILIDYQGMTGLSDVPKDSNYTIKNAYSSFNVGGVFKI
ncbi:porin family protein [Flavobacterium sp. HNIBRBA15423]|uniref:porin family protein n=1 Tax=Flavobacterium sp. HNIBRBA15423 TaxID=3458683 RepID=UPI004044ED53